MSNLDKFRKNDPFCQTLTITNEDMWPTRMLYLRTLIKEATNIVTLEFHNVVMKGEFFNILSAIAESQTIKYLRFDKVRDERFTSLTKFNIIDMFNKNKSIKSFYFHITNHTIRHDIIDGIKVGQHLTHIILKNEITPELSRGVCDAVSQHPSIISLKMELEVMLYHADFEKLVTTPQLERLVLRCNNNRLLYTNPDLTVSNIGIMMRLKRDDIRLKCFKLDLNASAESIDYADLFTLNPSITNLRFRHRIHFSNSTDNLLELMANNTWLQRLELENIIMSDAATFFQGLALNTSLHTLSFENSMMHYSDQKVLFDVICQSQTLTSVNLYGVDLYGSGTEFSRIFNENKSLMHFGLPHIAGYENRLIENRYSPLATNTNLITLCPKKHQRVAFLYHGQAFTDVFRTVFQTNTTLQYFTLPNRKDIYRMDHSHHPTERYLARNRHLAQTLFGLLFPVLELWDSHPVSTKPSVSKPTTKRQRLR